MSKVDAKLEALVAMSRELGDPANDYLILGEGNTSALVDEQSFFVKASGVHLQGIDETGFVRVARQPIRWMLQAESMTDEQIKGGLMDACLGDGSQRPSVETFFHAALLELAGVEFIGHSHPAAVNALLCSNQAEQAVAGRLFPDEIVYCGPASAFVPYTDPGLPLAHAVRKAADEFIEQYQVPPRVIVMQNHGMIALGGTPAEVLAATAMAVRAARARIGAQAFGGVRPLTPEEAERIFTRPDEHDRQDKLRDD
jgi:rhamnose utilization protein RhaD (predicted bifunctional aldolase and dehydrogenase)